MGVVVPPARVSDERLVCVPGRLHARRLGGRLPRDVGRERPHHPAAHLADGGCVSHREAGARYGKRRRRVYEQPGRHQGQGPDHAVQDRPLLPSEFKSPCIPIAKIAY